jgi:polar amino acid transport system substrate-binding protein
MLKKIITIIIVAIMSLSVFPPCVNAENNFKIAYPEFYPFFAKNGKGEMEGFFYEIITEAIEHRMGVSITWTQMPWMRCQESVRSGKSDAMITVPTKERSFYCETHSDPFYMKELKLFTYIGHDKLNDIKNIQSKMDIKNGSYTVITYRGNGWHSKNISSIGIKSCETGEVHNVWKMLAAKRGDLVIEWPIGASAGINKAGSEDKIIETGVRLESMPFHLLISKKSAKKDILIRFNNVVKDMFNDGTMQSIVSVYY